MSGGRGAGGGGQPFPRQTNCTVDRLRKRGAKEYVPLVLPLCFYVTKVYPTRSFIQKTIDVIFS